MEDDVDTKYRIVIGARLLHVGHDDEAELVTMGLARVQLSPCICFGRRTYCSNDMITSF